MQIETNEKVLAMYHAVAALMDEGRDIHNLKVSDITQKAGIGKGTAYEYFRSKEELLAKAICYDFAVQFQSLEKELEEKNKLKEALDSCFDWMDSHTMSPRMVMQFINALSIIFSKKADDFLNNEEPEHHKYGKRVTDMIMNRIIAVGKKEGTIHPQIPDDMVCLEVLAKLFAYFAWLQKKEKEIERIQVRDYLYESMKRALSQPVQHF